MTLFKTLMAGLVLTFSGTSPALACEILLRKLPGQVAPRDANAVNQPVELADLVSQNIYFPVAGKKDTFWTVVFDPDVKDKNQGHYVVGSWDKDQFVAHSVGRASWDKQRDYFHSISDKYQIEEKLFTIKGQQFKVKGWVEAKIWLKHDLRLGDVKSALKGAKGRRVYEETNGVLRRVLYGPATNGRLIKVIFAESQAGSGLPHTLVTAFEEAPESDSSEGH